MQGDDVGGDEALDDDGAGPLEHELRRIAAVDVGLQPNRVVHWFKSARESDKDKERKFDPKASRVVHGL